jgi:hypothetical protein
MDIFDGNWLREIPERKHILNYPIENTWRIGQAEDSISL